MKIKQVIYEGLTPRQRVIATVKAQARGDKNEVKKLIDTCPKETYVLTDPVYTDTMQVLVMLSTVVECDIRGYMIGILLAMIAKQSDAVKIFSQNISSIQAAWHEILGSQGIDPDEMSEIAATKHPAFCEIQNLLPEPDAAFLSSYKKILQSSLNKIS